MNKCIKFLIYLRQKIKNNIIMMVKKDGLNLQFVCKKFKNDEDVVMIAVKRCGISLLYASDNLKDNKEIVMAAVIQNGNALQYASEQLKNDKKVVMMAVQNYGQALRYAGVELKDDKEIVLCALNNKNNLIERNNLIVSENFYLFGKDIKKLINGLTNIEDMVFILKSSIEQEHLNENIVNINSKTKLNKI